MIIACIVIFWKGSGNRKRTLGKNPGNLTKVWTLIMHQYRCIGCDKCIRVV